MYYRIFEMMSDASMDELVKAFFTPPRSITRSKSTFPGSFASVLEISFATIKPTITMTRNNRSFGTKVESSQPNCKGAGEFVLHVNLQSWVAPIGRQGHFVCRACPK